MKYALCCGINNYLNPANALKGCINDANDWANVLKTTFKFDEVETLYDSMVTKNNILSTLRDKIYFASPGDVIVFTYSGHGTQVVDQNADETDGYDEALYVYDGPIIDDELREVLDEVHPGVHVVMILDSCFSGTATRKIGTDYFKPRFIPNPKAVGRAKNTTLEVPQEEMEEILLSGCNDNEYSYDAYINGKYNGAFTANALPLLALGNTYAQFHTKLKQILPSSKFPQSPQLEGKQENLGKELFFETPVAPPPPPPPVEPPTPIPPVTYPGGSSGGCLVALCILAIIITLILLV